jgi:hypothetical protein
MLRKLAVLALVAVFSLALTAPASAAGWHGGHGGGHGWHGGHHGGHGCCFFGGFFLGAALAAPFYYPYYGYPYAYPYGYPYAYGDPGAYSAPVTYQTAAPPTAAIQREACYPSGCYHLQGDGVSVPYQWVWVPAAPAAPPTR